MITERPNNAEFILGTIVTFRPYDDSYVRKVIGYDYSMSGELRYALTEPDSMFGYTLAAGRSIKESDEYISWENDPEYE